MAPAICRHEHVRFRLGAVEIECIDCGRRWHEVDGDRLAASEFANVLTMPPFDTRHSPYVAPRKEKKEGPK